MSRKSIEHLKFIQFLTLDKLQGVKHFLSKNEFMVNAGNDDDDWHNLEEGVLCGFAMYLDEGTNQLRFFPITSRNIVFGETTFSKYTDIEYEDVVDEIIEDIRAKREKNKI